MVCRRPGIVTYRFKRVTFGVNCSPFFLNATVRHHLSLQEDSMAVRELRENLYVDDLLSGADSPEGVVLLYENAKAVLEEAGMVLTKWSQLPDV